MFSHRPLVSIITPSYNQCDFIEETICSVLSQDYNNIEYIIVDGDSSDGTHLILDNYRDRVDVILIEKDEGQSDAINKGLRLSTGSIIMWLNSDDVLCPDAVSFAVTTFEQNPSSLMIHGHSMLFGTSVKSQLIGLDKGDFFFKYPAFMSFPQPASFFRRSLIDQSGLLDVSLHYGMDFDLTVRAFLYGDITYCDKLFSRYRIHSSSKTNSASSFVADWRIVFTRFVNSYPEFNNWRYLLIAHSLHSGSASSYSRKRILTEPEFLHILFFHLSTCAHMLYQSEDHAGSIKYLRFLRLFLPSYYSSASLWKLYFRCFLPPALVRFLRYSF